MGAGFFPFARTSPAFRDLDLEGAGVRWENAPFESCHPALDDSYACIARDPEISRQHFGSPRDGDAFARLSRFHAGIEGRLLDALLRPVPALGPPLRLGPLALLRIGGMFMQSGAGSRALSSRARPRGACIPSLALHVDVGPDDVFGAGLGYMLGLTATTGGYAVPVGGAQAVTNTLVTMLEGHGGRLRLGARVKRIIVRRGRARGVVLEDGEEIRAERAVLADTSAPALYLDLLARRDVPGWLVARMRRFEQGFGTFKLDWALARAVPWRTRRRDRAPSFTRPKASTTSRISCAKCAAASSPTGPTS